MFIALLVFVCTESALAVPLSVYHERVRRAITLIGLIGATRQGDEGAGNSRRERSNETSSALEEIRGTLAAKETIEWNGEILHVDNEWLAESLDNYERMSPADPQRSEWLTRISERLRALDERLSEIEGKPGKSVDKEEEKARLAAILRRAEYNNQAEEGNAITRLWRRIMEWLRKLFPERGPAGPKRENRAVNNGAQIIVALLSLAVIIYVGWRFLPRLLRRDMKKRKKSKRGARVVLGEQLSADETSSDLLTEAERLARSGDVRGAIRKGYIALLCELHDRKLVRLEQHKTNRDYLRAVEMNRPLYDEMKPMTMSFENHWYGLIPAKEMDWQVFRKHYQKAVTSDR